jgi:hypothetical protein
MKPSSKNEPVIQEREVIIPLDPAHEEKPTLMEQERIEKEQAEKAENQLTIHKEEAVCPLPDEEESNPAHKEDQSEEDEEREREEITK